MTNFNDLPGDKTGWMPGVSYILWNEYGYSDLPADTMYAQAAMFHIMSGFKRTMDAWAASPEAERVSCHFGIARKCPSCVNADPKRSCPTPLRHITQYISIWTPAYHAGATNAPDGWGQEMMNRYGLNPNKWCIGIEQEGFSQDPISYDYDFLYGAGTDAKGRARQPWPEPMVQADKLILEWFFKAGQWLVDAPDKKDRILTHNQTDSKTRAQDPGDAFLSDVKPRLVAFVSGQPDPATPTPPTTPPVTPPPPAFVPNVQSALTHIDAARRDLAG